MIILQILCLLFLMPLTFLLLIIFNIYLSHWIYLVFTTIYLLIYSMLFGLLFVSLHAAFYIFIGLLILYAIRMYYLSATIKISNIRKNYPILRANIRIKHEFNFILFFPLSFLKIIKLTPNLLAKKIMKQAKLKMELSELIDKIIDGCKGTSIDITTNDVNLYFEVN